MVYYWPLEKLIEESGNINKKNLQIRIKETLPWYVFLVGYLNNCCFATVQDCYGWIEEIFRELGKDKFNVYVSYTQDEKEMKKGYVYRNRMRLADIKWKDIKNAMFFFETKEEPPQCTKVFMSIMKWLEKKYTLDLTYDPYELGETSETILHLISITEKYFEVDRLFADLLLLSRDPSSFAEGFQSVGKMNLFEKLVCSSIGYNNFGDDMTLPFLFRMSYVPSDGLKEDKYCTIDARKKRAWINFGKELPENLIDYLDNEDWRVWYQQLESLQLVRFLTYAPNIKEFR